MYRTAASTASSYPTIASSHDTSLSSSDILHQNRVQRELHQAVRDSIVAERILERQARKKYPLTQEEKEQQRLAKRQWEISNNTLKRIAEEHTTLLQVASKQKNIAEVSEKKRLEMHPRLQQALVETAKPNHHGLVQQVFSENTPDITDFIREQEDALKTVRRKLRRFNWRPQNDSRCGNNFSMASADALKSNKDEPTPEELLAFIRLQEQELTAIQQKRAKTSTSTATKKNNQKTNRSTTPQRRGASVASGKTNSSRKSQPPRVVGQSSMPRRHGASVASGKTNASKKSRRSVDPEPSIPRQGTKSVAQPLKMQSLPPSLGGLKNSAANSSDIAIANTLRKEQFEADDTSLPASLDEFIHEQRRAFEQFKPAQRNAPQKRDSGSSVRSRRQQQIAGDSDDEVSLPPPRRQSQQRNPFEDSRHSSITQRKKPPPPLPPLPSSFQNRPPSTLDNKKATPPPFLVYAQAAKSAPKEQEEQQHRTSMSTTDAPSMYSYRSGPTEAKASTGSYGSKSFPSAPLLHDMKSDGGDSIPPRSKTEEQSLLSVMSDIHSSVAEDEQEDNKNVALIRRSLGLNDHSCCLRHPNQLVCEYTSAYKYDKVMPCLVCSSERRAGSLSSSADNSTEMAVLIGDIQQLQSDRKQWRKKTNVMYHGRTSYRSSSRSILGLDNGDDGDDDEPLTDEQWERLVRQRVRQVDGWEHRTALKHNPLCERYFRMLQMGVPMTTVRAECIGVGDDPRILEMDPERPLMEQLDEMYYSDPQTRHALLLKYHRGAPKEDADIDQIVRNVISAFDEEYAKAMGRNKLQSKPAAQRGVPLPANANAELLVDTGELNRLQRLEEAARLKAEDASRRRRAETDKRLKAEEELQRLQRLENETRLKAEDASRRRRAETDQRLKAEEELQRLQKLENEARLKAEDASRRRRDEVATRMQTEDALRHIQEAEAAARLELKQNTEELRRLEAKSADASLRRREEAEKRMQLEEELRQLQKENERRMQEEQAVVETKLQEARRQAAIDAERLLEEQRLRHKSLEDAAKSMIQKQALQLRKLEAERADAKQRIHLLEDEKEAIEARLKTEGSVHSSSVRARAIEKEKRNEAEEATQEMLSMQAKILQEEAQARSEAEERAASLAQQLEALKTERESAKAEVAKLKAIEQDRIEVANKAMENAKRLEAEKLFVAAKLKEAEEEASRLKANEKSMGEQTRKLEEEAARTAKAELEKETRRLNARLKEEESARQKAEAAMKNSEAASRIKTVEEFKAKADVDARLKEEEQARLKAEREASRLRREAKEAKDLVAVAEAAEKELRLQAEKEAKGKAEIEARLKAAEEARIKAEKEAARLLNRIAEEEAARAKAREASQSPRKRKDGRKSIIGNVLRSGEPKPQDKKFKSLSVSVPPTPDSLPPLSDFSTDGVDSQSKMDFAEDSESSEEEILEEEYFSSDEEDVIEDEDEVIEEEYVSDSEEESVEEVMDDSDDDEDETSRVVEDEGEGVIFINPPPLPPQNKKKPAGDAEYRQQLIDSELASIIKETESNELEEPLEPEAIEALRVAANNLAYRKKYYSSVADKYVYFPSVTRLLVDYSMIEEAEKYYYDEEDEFPIEYSAAIRAIACEKIENDNENEEMEQFAVDVEDSAQYPRPSGFQLMEGPTDVSDEDISTLQDMSGRSMDLSDDDYVPSAVPGTKKKPWMYPVNIEE